MVPGTSQTAVELKEVYALRNLKCKLFLLGTTKIQSKDKKLEDEFVSLAEKADEIWSVGPDIYVHYQAILQELGSQPHDNHGEILLQPQIKNLPNLEEETSEKPRRKIVSMWNKPIPFYHKGKKMSSAGSDIKCFCSLGAALGKVNTESYQRHKMQWNVHGLRFKDSKIASIKNTVKQNKLKLNALGKVPLVDNLDWSNQAAFICPDVVDESFNFIALCTIWLGIPTLVSSQSSIGKFLSKLSCPAAEKAIVTLTGIPLEDTDAWVKKINKVILSEDAKSM